MPARNRLLSGGCFSRLVFLLVLGISQVNVMLANEPGAAAVDFLEKVRSGEVDLKPGGDTALQANTSPGKREVIENFIKRLKGDLIEGAFVVSGVKEEGDFAAVMVGNISKENSDEVRIFPVAMVRLGKDWRAAPILASFENSVSGYTTSVKERLVGLEGWMMRERVVGLEKLISESTERMRKDIRGAIGGEDLKGGDLGKIVSRFRQACVAGDESALLGYLGGLSDPLPEDWAVRQSVAREAASAAASERLPWRLFSSDQVIWEVVNVEADGSEGFVSVACLDPDLDDREQGKAQIDVIHISLRKDVEGFWRLDLPAAFLDDDWEESDFSGDLDMDLQVRFLELLRKKDPVLKASDEVEVEKSFVATLKEGSLRQLLRHVSMTGDAEEANSSVLLAVELWWSVNREGGLLVPMLLGNLGNENAAVAAYQWFHFGKPEVFDMEVLTFKESGGGWLFDRNGGNSPDLDISGWLNEREPIWRSEWPDTLASKSVGIEKLPEVEVIDEVEAEKLARKWVDALNKKDGLEALALTAWMDRGNGFPSRVSRNLSYNLSSAGRAKAVFKKIYKSDTWVCAGIGFTNENDFSRDSFLPLVKTPKGLRVLAEVDLLVGGDRSRVYLNKASLSKFSKFSGKESVADLSKLFEQFEKDSE